MIAPGDFVHLTGVGSNGAVMLWRDYEIVVIHDNEQIHLKNVHDKQPKGEHGIVLALFRINKIQRHVAFVFFSTSDIFGYAWDFTFSKVM